MKKNEWKKDIACATFLYVLLAMFLKVLLTMANTTIDSEDSLFVLRIVSVVSASCSTVLLLISYYNTFCTMQKNPIEAKENRDVIDAVTADFKSHTHAIVDGIRDYADFLLNVLKEVDDLDSNNDEVSVKKASTQSEDYLKAGRVFVALAKDMDADSKCYTEPFTEINEKREKQCHRMVEVYGNIVKFLEEDFTVDSVSFDTYKRGVDSALMSFNRNLQLIHRCIKVFDFTMYNDVCVESKSVEDLDSTSVFYIKRVNEAVKANSVILQKLEALQMELVNLDSDTSVSLDHLDNLISEIKDYMKVGDC